MKNEAVLEEKTLIGMKVNVQEDLDIQTEWTCPGCGHSHKKKSVMFPRGMQMLRCHVCKQKLEKDAETGEWKTINHIQKKPRTRYQEHPYEEVSRGTVGIVVEVKEDRHVEARKFRCPHCNDAAFFSMVGRLATQFPGPVGQRFYKTGEYLDEKHHAVDKTLMRCHVCSTLLSSDDDGKTWSVYKEGDPLKKFIPKPVDPVEIRYFEIEPKIATCLSFVCRCGKKNLIELEDDKKEPITALKCAECGQGAFRRKGNKVNSKFKGAYAVTAEK